MEVISCDGGADGSIRGTKSCVCSGMRGHRALRDLPGPVAALTAVLVTLATPASAQAQPLIILMFE